MDLAIVSPFTGNPAVAAFDVRCRHAYVAGDPPPSEQIEADTSDDEDAPITSNDELFAAVAAVRLGY